MENIIKILFLLILGISFVNAKDIRGKSYEINKNDKDTVRIAFKKKHNSLKFASDALKNDKEFMLELLKINQDAYDYIGDRLKKDKELALIGLGGWGRRFKHMDISLRDDLEVVLKAIKQDITNFQYASNRLRSDKKFVLNYITNHNAKIIKYTTKEFKNNKQLMIEAINKNPDSYKWIGESLKEDADICLTAVKNRGYLLQYLSKACRLNREIVKAAVTNDPNALMYADKQFRNDKEIVTIAIKSKGYTLHYASLALKKDKALIKLAKKSDNPYVENPIKHTVHLDAWGSYILDDTLEILYGKDANFIQTKKLKVTNDIKIETTLKLKSIAILRRHLVAWYPVQNGNPVNISIKVKDGKYTVVGEGINGKLYINTYNNTKEAYQATCMPVANLIKKYKFYNAHLKRKISYNNDGAYVEFMIVNDTLEKDNLELGVQRKVDFFVAKVRIEVGGKTVYSMYMNRSMVKNPYFTVYLPGVKKDQNITIYCTDTKHPKEYIWEDKVEFSKKYQNKNY